jgi:hypothetical protein
MKQFIRAYRLIVGPVEGEGREYTDLRCQFEIEKTTESSPNQSKIAIYNLSEDSREFLRDETQANKAILEVGYLGLKGEPQIKRVFSGDILKSTDQYKAPDRLTVMDVGDAQNAITDTQFNISFKDGIPIKQIITQAAQSLRVSIGKLTDDQLTEVANESLTGGFVAHGTAKKTLDVLFDRLGIDWSVQDGELKVGESVFAPEAVRLGFDTGLLDEPITDKNGETSFRALINPDVAPHKTVQLVGNNIDKQLVVKSCKYKGDTREGEWIMEGITYAG